jgi:two-component system sensor histidine kinase MprB
VSLRWRLAALFAVLGAVAIGTATVVAWITISDELRDEVDTFLHRRAEELLEGRRELPGDPDAPVPGRPGGPPLGFDPDALIQSLSAGGERQAFLTTELPVDDADRAVAMGDRDLHLRTETVDGTELRILTTPVEGGGAVQVARDLTETNDVLDVLAGRLVLITLAGAAVAGLVGWLVARRITRPVRALADAAEEVAATEDLAVPVPVHGTDEVGRLGTSFNTMLAVLADSRRQQQQLVQDASHELRTPLTSLRTSAELLERGHDLDPQERERLLAVVAAESRELTDLVTELVELATDRRAGDAPFGEVSLDEIVARAVDQSRERSGRRVTAALEPVVVLGDAVLLDRAVRNLLDNADKFSPAATVTEVTLTVGDGRARLVVRDQGPGIPEEDRERVFDRFYRSAGTRTLPGSGLGLAIVAQVVDAHGGVIRAEAVDGPGTAIVVDLPVPSEGS